MPSGMDASGEGVRQTPGVALGIKPLPGSALWTPPSTITPRQSDGTGRSAWRKPPSLDLLEGCVCPREEQPKPGECSALVGLSLNLKHAAQAQNAQPCSIISWNQGRVERKVWLCLRRHPVRPPWAGALMCPFVRAGVCPGGHFTPDPAWM